MFETYKNKFSNMNKTHFVLIIIFVFLLLGASLYTYYYYIEPRMNPNFIPNKEFIEQDPYKPAKMKFFYVDWCPHCKTAKPIWEEVKKKYNHKKINNTLVIFEEINCELPTNKGDLDKYNIQGYPTIKLIKGGDNNAKRGDPGYEEIEYDAKPDETNLVEFLNTVI